MSEAPQIRSLERSHLRALVAADMALAQPMHAPDFQLITPGGVAFSCDQYLGRIEQGALRYLRWEPDAEMAVRVSGRDSAVLGYVAMRSLGGGACRCATGISTLTSAMPRVIGRSSGPRPLRSSRRAEPTSRRRRMRHNHQQTSMFRRIFP